MDFTEAPEYIKESIMQSIEDKLGVEFDEANDYHMELAQEAMCDDWSGN
jgi:hypothetical protein